MPCVSCSHPCLPRLGGCILKLWAKVEPSVFKSSLSVYFITGMEKYLKHYDTINSLKKEFFHYGLLLIFFHIKLQSFFSKICLWLIRLMCLIFCFNFLKKDSDKQRFTDWNKLPSKLEGYLSQCGSSPAQHVYWKRNMHPQHLHIKMLLEVQSMLVEFQNQIRFYLSALLFFLYFYGVISHHVSVFKTFT